MPTKFTLVHKLVIASRYTFAPQTLSDELSHVDEIVRSPPATYLSVLRAREMTCAGGLDMMAMTATSSGRGVDSLSFGFNPCGSPNKL